MAMSMSSSSMAMPVSMFMEENQTDYVYQQTNDSHNKNEDRVVDLFCLD